jgi:hypothetical protein
VVQLTGEYSALIVIDRIRQVINDWIRLARPPGNACEPQRFIATSRGRNDHFIVVTNASRPTDQWQVIQGEEDASEGAVRGNVKNRGLQRVEGTSEFAQLDTGKFPEINVRHRQALPDDSFLRFEEVIPWTWITGNRENSANSRQRRYSILGTDVTTRRNRHGSGEIQCP